MRRSDGAHTSPPEFEHARYEAGEELGRGAQGVMVRVVDREAPSRDLVAKVWRGEAFRAQALLGEYALLSRARIPGLVRAHDLARCARTGAVSLVEDFIDGPEAAAWASAAPTNARAGPLLLVLDDLHLAPAELAAAVDAYRCRGRERGVTIVATAPSAPDGAEAITIGPLDEAGFEALCTRADAARLEEAHDPTRHARGEVEMRASRASLLVPALLLLYRLRRRDAHVVPIVPIVHIVHIVVRAGREAGAAGALAAHAVGGRHAGLPGRALRAGQAAAVDVKPNGATFPGVEPHLPLFARA